MPWFKVDDGFHGHPKVVELSLSAVGLWTLAGSWCAKYLTDGFVPKKTVTRLGGDVEQAQELVTSDLWFTAQGGYEFKDWAHYQPLKEAVEAERAAAQERMRKARASKKGVRPNIGGTTGDGSPEVPVTPSQSQSHPDPTPKGVEPRNRGSRIPEPFIVTRDMRSWAAERTPGVDVDSSTEKFVNYWRAKTRDATKRDWELTWHNWLITDFERSTMTARKPKAEQIVDVLEQGRQLQQQEDMRAIG